MKIRRNALCPCNSGKKYKHCCIYFDFDNPDYPIKFLGYDEQDPDPVCLISNITTLNQEAIQEQFKASFPIGSWFISFGSHNYVELYGPYMSAEICVRAVLDEHPQIKFQLGTKTVRFD